MKTAIVHDWLISPFGGAENVLTEIMHLFPSPIYTLLFDAKNFQNTAFIEQEIHTSFLQRIPSIKTTYRNFLPLFPFAIESLQCKDFDLILSSSHCVAKAIKKRAYQVHICYCHTPMRYVWDLMDDYLFQENLHQTIKGRLIRKYLCHLQKWDRNTVDRVDHFIANSHFVAHRISKFYGRNATVIYPPVDTDFFQCYTEKEDYYLCASRLVANKRIDLIIETFSHFPNKQLLVIGNGPQKRLLEKKATQNVKFLGQLSKEELRFYLQRAKGFIFAAIEDFGILPVEAMACGTAVIALKAGGCLETVIERTTGIFFEKQTVASLKNAVLEFEKMQFDPSQCRKQAEKFSKQKFHRHYQQFVIDTYI